MSVRVPKEKKPRIAVWKFTSCDGCQLTLLDSKTELLDWMEGIELAYFPEATSKALKGTVDLSLVEGSISTPHEAERIQEVRRVSKYVVTMGACASAGGLQALRNFKNMDDFASMVYASPEFVETLSKSTPINEHIEVDFELRGCPVNQTMLMETIQSFLFDKPRPEVPNRSVCVDCKKLGVVCIMTNEHKPCMGPLTQAGCGALCPSYDRTCSGCYGPKANANPTGVARLWRQLGVTEPEIYRAFRGLNSYAEILKKEGVTNESN
jgi:coenzyme F420-reducing hydrogenase gamma subunit